MTMVGQRLLSDTAWVEREKDAVKPPPIGTAAHWSEQTTQKITHISNYQFTVGVCRLIDKGNGCLALPWTAPALGYNTPSYSLLYTSRANPAGINGTTACRNGSHGTSVSKKVKITTQSRHRIRVCHSPPTLLPCPWCARVLPCFYGSWELLSQESTLGLRWQLWHCSVQVSASSFTWKATAYPQEVFLSPAQLQTQQGSRAQERL